MGGQRRRTVTVSAGVIGLAVGVAVLAQMETSSHPGKAHYQAYCGACHDRDGVLAILDQRSDEAERLLATAHVERHVADAGERAQLIAYLKREMDR